MTDTDRDQLEADLRDAVDALEARSKPGFGYGYVTGVLTARASDEDLRAVLRLVKDQ